MKPSELAPVLRDAGTIEAGMLTVLNSVEPSLEAAQAIVGGNVELITLDDGDQLLVDEEGRMKQLPVNTVATLLAQRVIVGPALLLCGEARWS